MTPEDVCLLARSAPERWTELELVHRSDYLDVRATLRHGELAGTRLDNGRRIHELGEGVEISDVRSEELFGRPSVAFVARAVPGYDPVCSCCPLVFSEVSQRLEHGVDWRAELGELPDGVDLALDLGVGIVVRSRHRGGRLGHWFTNEIIRAA